MESMKPITAQWRSSSSKERNCKHTELKLQRVLSVSNKARIQQRNAPPERLRGQGGVLTRQKAHGEENKQTKN